ncbi:TetR/AcrR family transcriptional regulator [Nocardioides immobilis]|uniref:TetR/AcrR family transcriptional regulator n=1 Tax=Nocardioides immobilis TaxID=2049295 RepID=A0A417Y6K2_9ACTN|nr:TetR/AcrR family transcriptional regulator [Nocardioides immobilis]RHW28151.1 TetR/AcrR family transcriptional regulator [Nocardioides immobilis]
MTAEPTPKKTRPRGRPRLDIDPDAVADAVAELFAEGGLEAVSILDTAEKLSVSRATLYRTVPTKEHLIGILFERSTGELTRNARATVKEIDDPAEQLLNLVRLQVDAAIRMRRYMPVFFGGGDLPPDVFERWHKWSREYEKIWVSVVKDNMEKGALADADPVITARLLLGSCIWVSRWYRPKDKYSPEEITEVALNLVRALQSPAKPTAEKPAKRAGVRAPRK